MIGVVGTVMCMMFMVAAADAALDGNDALEQYYGFLAVLSLAGAFYGFDQAMKEAGVTADQLAVAKENASVVTDSNIDINNTTVPPVSGGARGTIGSAGNTGTFEAPKITVNSKGELTNGQYTINHTDMEVHVDGKDPMKSQFMFDVDANKAVLDAAAYADANNLWVASSGNPADFANKAKVYIINGPVGVTGSGKLTNYVNVYRTKTGYIHGCPGNP